jgi:hypothetical protein
MRLAVLDKFLASNFHRIYSSSHRVRMDVKELTPDLANKFFIDGVQH